MSLFSTNMAISQMKLKNRTDRVSLYLWVQVCSSLKLTQRRWANINLVTRQDATHVHRVDSRVTGKSSWSSTEEHTKGRNHLFVHCATNDLHTNDIFRCINVRMSQKSIRVPCVTNSWRGGEVWFCTRHNTLMVKIFITVRRVIRALRRVGGCLPTRKFITGNRFTVVPSARNVVQRCML